VPRPTSGKHRNSSSRSNLKTPLEMQEKMENAWVLVSTDPLNSAFLDGGVAHLPCRRPSALRQRRATLEVLFDLLRVLAERALCAGVAPVAT
jgi:hypothetical protein